MSLALIIYIIVVHFVFDWILQPRRMARQKTKSMKIALVHAGMASFPLLLALPALTVIIYAGLHAVQDRHLYNWLERFWDSGNAERNMVNHTALDQILHLIILFSLINYSL